jgi:acyl-CoA dehydrogenase
MNELQIILSETAERLFAEHVTKEVLEAAENGAWPSDLWSAVEENGLTKPLVPDSQGGAGAGWAEAFVILHAAGRFAAPIPLAETIIAGRLLSRAGLDTPPGPLTVAPIKQAETLRLDGKDGGRIAGAASAVPWGAGVEHIAVLAEKEGELHVALIARDAYIAEGDRNIAADARDRVIFDDSPVIAAAPAPDGITRDAIWPMGALARAAQMAGGVGRILAESVRYANDRKQFGRPIARFQAVQQQLAVLASHAAAADMAAETAALAADRGDAAFEIACAKVITGEAAGLGAGIAHQVHGAIGFTYEHALHFITRRLWSWRGEFGPENAWAERIGQDVIGRGADALWSDLTARQAG